MPIITVNNASGGAIQGWTVIKAAVATSTLGTWSGAAPINASVSLPVGAAGRLRLVCGVGTSPCTAKLTASVVAIGLYQTVPIAVTGPGSYEWPPGRKAIAALCKSLQIDSAPGGTTSLEFDAYTGLVGTDAASQVLGIASRPCGDGLPLNIITSGPARAACSGGWKSGDALVCAASGALRKLAGGETGLDRVAYAAADASDGDTGCPVNVDIAAV